jgi:hypothetical protein
MAPKNSKCDALGSRMYRNFLVSVCVERRLALRPSQTTNVDIEVRARSDNQFGNLNDISWIQLLPNARDVIAKEHFSDYQITI